MIFIAAYKYSHEKVGAIGPCRVTVSSYERFYAFHFVKLCRGWSRKMSLAALIALVLGHLTPNAISRNGGSKLPDFSILHVLLRSARSNCPWHSRYHGPTPVGTRISM